MLKLQFSDNRQPALWIVDEVFRIGSDIKNQVRLADEGVMPLHAQIRQQGNRMILEPADPQARLLVNGNPVTANTILNVGDRIHVANVELVLIDPTRQVMPAVPVVGRGIADEPAEVKWEIKAMTGPLAGRVIPVRSQQTVGRDPASDIVISGQHVSRRHAQFLLRGNELWIKDLGSSNGTYVNTQKVMERPLHVGDEIKFDAVIFRVITGNAAPAAAASDANLDKTQFRPALNIPPAPVPGQTAGAIPPAAPVVSPAEPVMSSPATAMVPPASPLSEPAAPPVSAAPAPLADPASGPAPGPAGQPEPAKGMSVNMVGTILLLILIIGLVLLGVTLLGNGLS